MTEDCGFISDTTIQNSNLALAKLKFMKISRNSISSDLLMKVHFITNI